MVQEVSRPKAELLYILLYSVLAFEGINLSRGPSTSSVTQDQSKQGNGDRYLGALFNEHLLKHLNSMQQQTPTGDKNQNCSCLNLWEAALPEILLILLN